MSRSVENAPEAGRCVHFPVLGQQEVRVHDDRLVSWHVKVGQQRPQPARRNGEDDLVFAAEPDRIV